MQFHSGHTRSALQAILLSLAAVPSSLQAADEIIDGGGSVTVPDSQTSPWNIDGKITIGGTGAGTLNINGGSKVTSVAGIIGDTLGSSGNVTVSGAGSVWTLTDTVAGIGDRSLIVGKFGTGTLTISEGGVVDASTGIFVAIGGYFNGIPTGGSGSGSVTVSGENSALKGGNTIILGRYANEAGSLTVSGGAKVTSQRGQVGQAGTGTLLLTGAGSNWTLTDTFSLQGAGSALTIENSGSLNIAGTGNLLAGTTATVTGTGSRLQIGTHATMSGIFQITEKATAGTGGNYTINGEGSRTTVNGTGSKLEIGANLVLGNNNSALVISNAAEVTAVGTLSIGNSTSGTRNATMTIESGGKLSTGGIADIGLSARQNATVTVTGVGSEWNSGGNIFLTKAAGNTTEAGHNTLTIADGGKVSINNGTGTLTMANAAIAYGNATLNIGNGGAAGTLEAATVTSGTGANASAQVNFNHTGTTTFSANLNGTKLSVTKSGSGTTILTGTNSTYTQATTVSAGTLLNNGSLGNTAITVASGAIYGGTGTHTGIINLQSGADISPGASVGTLTTGGATFSAGAGYIWELTDAGGNAGTGWDLLAISGGGLSIAATESDPFQFTLDTAGTLFGFDPSQNYDFTVVTTSTGITGFNAGAFAVDGSGISGSGVWTVGLSGDSNSLVLSYSAIPEPSTVALGALGLLAALRRRRAC